MSSAGVYLVTANSTRANRRLCLVAKPPCQIAGELVVFLLHPAERPRCGERRAGAPEDALDDMPVLDLHLVQKSLLLGDQRMAVIGGSITSGASAAP